MLFRSRRLATALVLSDALREGRLIVLNKLELKEVKTKSFIAVRDALKIESGLFVLAESNNEVELSGRNVPLSKIVLDGQMNLHDMLKFDHLVVTEDALSNLEKRLGGEG